MGMDVGTDIAEVREVDEACQPPSSGVELMVTQGRSIKSHLIHQCYHRIGRDVVHVIQRFTCAVVAGRKHQQTGVQRTQTVGNISQCREGFDCGMHIVAREDMYFTLLRQGTKANRQMANDKCQNKQTSFLHGIKCVYGSSNTIFCPSLSGASWSIS